MATSFSTFDKDRRDDDADATRLLANGYVILRDQIEPAVIASIRQEATHRFDRTPFCEGAFFGGGTKRFHGILNRLTRARDLVMHEAALDLAKGILLPHADTLQLNLTQAIELHPNEVQQFPHRDDEMWPLRDPAVEYLVHVIWPLTRFTPQNGGTLIWPGSHGPARGAGGDPIAAEMEPGDAVVMLGSTLHGSGTNRSTACRSAIVVSYCLGWLKPYENMWLTYPPEVARQFDSDLADLVGYRQHRPNIGGFDGRCPSLLLNGERPDFLAARDNMQPRAAAALNAYRVDQMARHRASQECEGAYVRSS